MLKGNMIEFETKGRSASAYVVEPSTEGQHPVLVIVHEWWGLNDHIKAIAGRFAAQGFSVIAPDLYDGKVTKDAGEAGRLMQSLERDRALETLNGAVSYLKTLPSVDASRIGVTGFCMGGTFALLLPTVNPDVKAAAPFYGDVPSDEELKNLSAPVFFIGAENDFWITKDKIDRLREALTRYGKQGEVKVYSGVGHAFFNDTRPDAYDKDAAEDAWQRVNKFFAEKLFL